MRLLGLKLGDGHHEFSENHNRIDSIVKELDRIANCTESQQFRDVIGDINLSCTRVRRAYAADFCSVSCLNEVLIKRSSNCFWSSR